MRGTAGRWIAVLLVLLLLASSAAVWLALREPRDRSTVAGRTETETRPATAPGADGRLPVGAPLPAPPDASGDGPDWTYRELLDYLRSRGLALKMRPCAGGQFYMLTDDDTELFAYAQLVRDGIIHSLGVVCDKTDSARTARESAGRHETGTFAWGRYYFRGDPDLLAWFRRALTTSERVADGFTDWTYEQLATHFRSRRLSVKVRPFTGGCVGLATGDGPGSPRLLVLTDRDAEADQIAAVYARARVLGGASVYGSDEGALDPSTIPLFCRAVICLSCPTSLRAQSVAGLGADGGRRSFSWRRFAFIVVRVGDGPDAPAEALSARLRAALGPP